MIGLGLAAPASSFGASFPGGASSDGSKVFFVSDERLAPEDSDRSFDVYQRAGGTTTRISSGQIKGNGAFDAFFADASSDGSRVVFFTDEQLVGGDTDTFGDVYERAGGVTNRISQGQMNGNGAFDAFFSGASSDGSRVFFSAFERLASGDTDDFLDVYERSAGTTAQVSQGEVNGNDIFDAFFSGASDDGSKVFLSTSEQLVSEDTDDFLDVYERSEGNTTWISQGEANGNGDFHAFFAGASNDGSTVFFTSDESLVSGDTDSSVDLYERTGGVIGTTTRVSQGEVNGNGAFDASFAGASSDGSTVFFTTDESLVVGDSDGSVDLYERTGGIIGTTTRVSQGEVSGNGAFDAAFAGASSDGSTVFFTTDESLVVGDSDGSVDLYERTGGIIGTTTRVSQGEVSGNGAFDAAFAGASSDGSKVFFTTDESLVGGDTDSSVDLYERSGGSTSWVSRGQVNGNGAFDASFAGASSDGSRIFFQTGERLAGGDTDSSADLYERSGGTTNRVSRGEVNGNGAFDASFAGASSDGSKVLFTTDEPLVGEDANGVQDIYERSEGTTRLVSVDMGPPQTTIDSGPAGGTNDPTPTFTFSSSEAGSSFECRLDSDSFSPCGSPKTAAHLDDGAHTLRVRATDPAGNTDPTPASRSFTVLTAEVSVSGSTLVVTAAAGGKDNLNITRPSPSTLRVTDFPGGAYTGSGVHTGAGCTRSGDYTANCDASGITLIQVFSYDRSDQVVNSTTTRGSLNGGGENDVVTGGAANDTLNGGTGADVMKGRNGNDRLLARDSESDTTINCDGGDTPGTADEAEVDALPKDPDSAITKCERVRRG